MNNLLKTVALLGVVLFASCKKSEVEVVTPEPEPAVHQNYSHGKPAGVAVSKTIGAEGGTLATANGSVLLTIPAGAVTKATEFSIQPVENTLPGARGLSYRLLPEKTEFTKPVTLRFSYTDFPMDGTIPEALFLSFQDADGRYWLMNDTQLDTRAKTLTVKTTHFSDWQVCEYYRVVADKTVVKPGETATLKLQHLQIGDDLLTSLQPIKGTWKNHAPRQDETVAWTLSGDGKLITSDWVATYKAPETAPAGNPVFISLKYNGFLMQYVNGRLTTSSKQLILTTPITIADKSFMTITFQGKTQTHWDAGFDDNTPITSISAGPDSDNYLFIHLKGVRKGEFSFGGINIEPGKSFIRYQYIDKKYESNKGWCMDRGVTDLPNVGQVVVEEYIKGQYIKGHFSGNLSDGDNGDCAPGGPSVSGKFVVWAD